MKKIAIALLFGIITLGAYAESRLALVVGNAAYKASPLKNSVNDASDIASALKEVGFEVVLATDIPLAEMKREVGALCERIQPTVSEVVFYFAGHGVQLDGKNYLVPIDADLQNEFDIMANCFPVDWLYDALDRKRAQTNIIILDSCRNNPLPSVTRSLERGLSVVSSAPAQSLIIYSTGANQVAFDGDGRNGIFTEAFLRHMKNGKDIELMLRDVRNEVLQKTKGRQNPYTYGAMTGGFTFSGGAEGSLTVTQVPLTSKEARNDPQSIALMGSIGFIPQGERETKSWELEASYYFKPWLSLNALTNTTWGTWLGTDFNSFTLVIGPGIRLFPTKTVQPRIEALWGYQRYESSSLVPAEQYYEDYNMHVRLGFDLRMSDNLLLCTGFEGGMRYYSIFMGISFEAKLARKE